MQSVAETVNQIPELRNEWVPIIESAYEDAALSVKIQEHVVENPGVLQNKMGKVLAVSGTETGRIIHILINLGVISATKSGKTYELRSNGR